MRFSFQMFYLENAETCSAQIACYIWTIFKACPIHMSDMKVHSLRKSWELVHLWTYIFFRYCFIIILGTFLNMKLVRSTFVFFLAYGVSTH